MELYDFFLRPLEIGDKVRCLPHIRIKDFLNEEFDNFGQIPEDFDRQMLKDLNNSQIFTIASAKLSRFPGESGYFNTTIRVKENSYNWRGCCFVKFTDTKDKFKLKEI